jgi:hypothetical protein
MRGEATGKDKDKKRQISLQIIPVHFTRNAMETDVSSPLANRAMISLRVNFPILYTPPS